MMNSSTVALQNYFVMSTPGPSDILVRLVGVPCSLV